MSSQLCIVVVILPVPNGFYASLTHIPQGLRPYFWGNREATLRDMGKIEWHLTTPKQNKDGTMCVIIVMHCT